MLIQRREVDILQVGRDRLEAVVGRLVGQDVQHGPAGLQPGRDDRELVAHFVEVLAVDRLAPDPPLDLTDQIRRRALKLNPAIGDHRHLRAQVGHIIDNMGRQDHRLFFADLGQQVVKAIALFRVQPGGGLVDDQQFRIAKQRLGNPEALAHAAGIAGHRLLAVIVQVGLDQQRLHRLAPGLAIVDPLEQRNVVEQILGIDARINAEILRQITQHRPDPVRLGADIDTLEMNRAAIGRLQRGNRAHQRRLAGPVGPQQPEHPGRNGQADIIQRPNVIAVSLAQTFDHQHAHCPR